MKRILAAALAVALWSLGQSAQAADSSLVFGANPDLSSGSLALQMGDYAEGVRLTRLGLRSEKSRKDRATGLNNLCAGLVGLREYAEALEACNASAAINANTWRLYNNRALAYLGLGRYELARADLNRGLELNPGGRKLLRVAEMINDQAPALLAEARR